MLTFRNVFALVLFLFGTTFLWLTAAFLGDKQAAAKGAVWTVVQVGAILVIVGFAAGAWGVFREASWWELIALVSAIVGLIVLIPYWIGAMAGSMAELRLDGQLMCSVNTCVQPWLAPNVAGASLL